MRHPKKPKKPKPKKPKGHKPKKPAKVKFKRPLVRPPRQPQPHHPRLGLPKIPLPPAVQPREQGLPAPNTTCDIYYSPNAPPAAPNVAGVACHLTARFVEGSEASVGSQTFRWTHLLYVTAAVDIRDTWPNVPANQVYIPDRNNTAFEVVFVELVNRGTAAAYKRVFLNRQTPTWPTGQL
jgi:hypothetical protein